MFASFIHLEDAEKGWGELQFLIWVIKQFSTLILTVLQCHATYLPFNLDFPPNGKKLHAQKMSIVIASLESPERIFTVSFIHKGPSPHSVD